MRLLAISIFLLLVAPLTAIAASPAETYRIVLPRRAVSAGERLDLSLVPKPPHGAGVAWSVRLTEGEGRGLYGGIYWAPYLIPSGVPPASVSAIIRDGETVSFANVRIELNPSSVPGVEDCLGPNQTFSVAAAALTPPQPLADTGGVLVHRVDPVYPRRAFVRGIRDTINIFALVCRSGLVLDAHENPSYRNTGENPFYPDPNSLIEHDPRLVEAAVAAVRQYVFAPAIVDGDPIAFEILTTVLFDPTDGPQVNDPHEGRPAVSIAPNPLNPSGLLTFTISKPGHVSVKIYDVRGRLVRTLIERRPMSAGTHMTNLDGRDTAGRALTTGVYYYRVQADGKDAAGRFAILK